MTVIDGLGEHRALVILNVCRDPVLREARAKTLNDAGYYTSSAQTPEEAIALAAQMKCAIAVVCHSFTAAERRSIQDWMRQHVPMTTVALLSQSGDEDPAFLLSAVRAAAASHAH